MRMEIAGFELSFIDEIVKYLHLENEGTEKEVIRIAFSPILDALHMEIKKSSFLLFNQYWFSLLQTFASIEALGELIIIHSSVKNKFTNEKNYADTLLGSLLNLSCIPKTQHGPYEFYDKPFGAVRIIFHYLISFDLF